MSDLALLGMDPRFGGGPKALTEAFWHAAVALGRQPELHYLSHPSLAGRTLLDTPLVEPGLKAPLGRFDAGTQFVGGLQLSRHMREARSVWVVAATAPYGYAAYGGQ